MPVIKMNVPCVVYDVSGTDQYGQQSYGVVRKSVCAIVKLVESTQHTTVRADSGATRGHADESVADAILLLPKQHQPKVNSKVVVRGVSLRITSCRTRMDVMGRLDHYEVRCAIE